MQTEWRRGFEGIEGLDKPGVRAVLDEEGLEGDERRDVWTALRAMEREFLDIVAERREAARKD